MDWLAKQHPCSNLLIRNHQFISKLRNSTKKKGVLSSALQKQASNNTPQQCEKKHVTEAKVTQAFNQAKPSINSATPQQLNPQTTPQNKTMNYKTKSKQNFHTLNTSLSPRLQLIPKNNKHAKTDSSTDHIMEQYIDAKRFMAEGQEKRGKQRGSQNRLEGWDDGGGQQGIEEGIEISTVKNEENREQKSRPISRNNNRQFETQKFLKQIKLKYAKALKQKDRVGRSRQKIILIQDENMADEPIAQTKIGQPGPQTNNINKTDTNSFVKYSRQNQRSRNLRMHTQYNINQDKDIFKKGFVPLNTIVPNARESFRNVRSYSRLNYASQNTDNLQQRVNHDGLVVRNDSRCKSRMSSKNLRTSKFQQYESMQREQRKQQNMTTPYRNITIDSCQLPNQQKSIMNHRLQKKHRQKLKATATIENQSQNQKANGNGNEHEYEDGRKAGESKVKSGRDGYRNKEYIGYNKLKKKNASLQYQNALIGENKARVKEGNRNRNTDVKFKGSGNEMIFFGGELPMHRNQRKKMIKFKLKYLNYQKNNHYSQLSTISPSSLERAKLYQPTSFRTIPAESIHDSSPQPIFSYRQPIPWETRISARGRQQFEKLKNLLQKEEQGHVYLLCEKQKTKGRHKDNERSSQDSRNKRRKEIEALIRNQGKCFCDCT